MTALAFFGLCFDDGNGVLLVAVLASNPFCLVLHFELCFK